jgi:hypothetical protein
MFPRYRPRAWRGLPALLLGAGITLGLAMTSCEKTHPDAADGGADADTPTAPILDPSHSGWKNPNCDLCHTLPIDGHTVTDTSACAPCHGGNGACDPNGADSPRVHNATDDCVPCHSQQHNYTVRSECASCHFAAAGGVVDCAGPPVPDGGLPPSDAGVTDGGAPILPTNLTSACYDWPATPFGPSNHVQGMNPMPAGSTAVDFTLRDLDGTQYTLSTLLATRPVLMVHGAFT